MDAAGSEHAALFGMSEGGPMAALFAATYPDRTSALILYSAFACAGAHLMEADELEDRMREIERDWPNSMDLSIPSPTIGRDPAYRRHWQTLMRYAASPGAALSLLRMNSTIDIRDVLPAVRVPTLVMYRTDSRFGHGAAAWRKEGADVLAPGPEAHYLADHIPWAELVELDGVDQLPWVGDADGLIGEVQEFLTGVRAARRGPEALTVASSLPLHAEDGTVGAAFTLRQGQRAWFALTAHRPEELRPETPDDAEIDRRLARTRQFWTEWLGVVLVRRPISRSGHQEHYHPQAADERPQAHRGLSHVPVPK
jgi:hypothetical protein